MNPMKMYKQITLGIVITALHLFHSCQKSEVSYAFPDFPTKGQLSSDILNADMMTGLPVDICCTEKYIVLLSPNNDCWLHIYDKETGAYLSSQIHLGHGANEYTWLCDLNYDAKNKVLTLVDPNQKKLLQFALSDSATLHPKHTTKIRNVTNAFRTTFPLDTNHLLISSKENPWLQITVMQGNTIATYTTPLQDPMEYAAMNSQSYAVLSPDGKHFALATLYGSIVTYFSINEGDIRLQNIGRYIRPMGKSDGFSLMFTEETVLGICDLCCTNEYLCGSMINSKSETFSTIVLWNWQGEPIAQFETGKLVHHLCFDPVNPDILYAYSIDKGQFILEKYHLPLH